jgi:hypothetical protein
VFSSYALAGTASRFEFWPFGQVQRQLSRGLRLASAPLQRKLRLNPSHELLNEGLVPLTNDGALDATHNSTTPKRWSEEDAAFDLDAFSRSGWGLTAFAR